MRGGRIQIPLKAGHHRPPSETPFKWPDIECWLGSFVILRGSRPIINIAMKPYIFVIFQGGGGGGGGGGGVPTRGLNFALGLPLLPPILHERRLWRVYAFMQTHLSFCCMTSDKYQNLMCWHTYITKAHMYNEKYVKDKEAKGPL